MLDITVIQAILDDWDEGEITRNELKYKYNVDIVTIYIIIACSKDKSVQEIEIMLSKITPTMTYNEIEIIIGRKVYL